MRILRFSLLLLVGVGASLQAGFRDPFSGAINIRTFGAIGDGTADNLGPFTNAIAAASTNARAIYIPSGIYILSGSLSLPSNFTLYGDGDGSIIRRAPGKDGAGEMAMLLATAATNITVRNLALDGNRSNQDPTLGLNANQGNLRFVQSSNCIVDGVFTASSLNYGLYLDSCQQIKCSHVISTDHVNPNNPAEPTAIAASLCSGVSMDACIAAGNGNSGFVVSRSVNVTIANCTSANNAGQGIEVVADATSPAFGISISHCQMATNAHAGLLVGFTGSVDTNNLAGIIVEGCSFNGNLGSGIDLQAARSAVIGNVFLANQWSGLTISGVTESLISGNVFLANNQSNVVGLSGIYLDAHQNQRVAIRHNIFLNGSGHQKYCVNLSSANDADTILAGNMTIGGYELAAISDAGTRTLIHSDEGNIGFWNTSAVVDANGNHYLTVGGADGLLGNVNLASIQSGAASPLGFLQWANFGIGAADKRVAAIAGYTSGATNSGELRFLTWAGGSAGVQWTIKPDGTLVANGNGIIEPMSGALTLRSGVGSAVVVDVGDLNIDTAGRGILIKEGANARLGQATLAAGAVAVANTSITGSTRIFLAYAPGAGGTIGSLYPSAISAGASFTISSSNGADTNKVNWLLIEPAP